MKLSVKIISIVTLLTLIGVLMIYSASQIWAEYKYNTEYYYLIRQFLFACIGIPLMIAISKIDYRLFQKYSTLFYLISLALLILVLVPGIGIVRGGARSWIGIGQFSVQPSEFIKISVIIVLSKYLSKHQEDIKSIKSVIFILGFVFFNFLFIMLQPDLGTGLVLVLTAVILIYIGGINVKYLLAATFFGILAFAGLVISAPYRMNRILAFLNPWEDPLGTGFQSIQSLYALAPNGFFGRGLFNSIQKFYYLPEPQTDFIFAIIVEELGLLGAVVIISLFVLLFIYGIKVSYKCKDKFASFLCLGLTSLVFVQVFINVSVVVGLLPVTGITLPFLSYGGSSLAINLISMGIIINIAKNIKEY